MHISAKKDEPSSAIAKGILACIQQVETCRQPKTANYKPIGPATLWHDTNEISTNHETTLRHAATTPALHQYMSHKYNWSDSTIACIDWNIHGKALQSLTPTRRKTMTKLIHEWLPVNGHPGRGHILTNQQCMTCKRETETQIHFLQCSLTPNDWETSLLQATDLNTAMNQTSHKGIKKLLQWALTNCRTNSRHLDRNQYPTALSKLISDQTAIGWDQIIKGRWTVEWVRQLDILTPDKGEKNATNILVSIWNATLNMWSKRCSIIHEDAAQLNISQLQQITPKIEALYNTKNQLDRIDQKNPGHTN
jgi:hypothetical protein